MNTISLPQGATFLRSFLYAVAVLVTVIVPARAQVEIDINQGNIEPLPIAVTRFQSTDDLGQQVADVVTADLRRSGLFNPVDPSAFIQQITDPNATPRFEDWRVIGAEAMVTGAVSREPDGRLKAEFRLWDTFAGQQLVGEQFFTQPENWRRVAHIIADAIYERLTGEQGYFDTRVVLFPKAARRMLARSVLP